MISIIICNRDNSRLQPLTENIFCQIGDVEYELIIIDNSLNNHSIFSAYNEGVNKSKYEKLLFIHDDIFFNTSKFGEALLNLDLPNLGVLGIAGSKSKTRITSPWWISNHEKVPKGILFQSNIQHFSNGNAERVNVGFTHENQVEEVILVDGVLLYTTKENCLIDPFDENYGSFHFYDLDFSLKMKKSGKTNYVTNSIFIEHYSAGSLNKDWVKSSFIFDHKWNKVSKFSFNTNNYLERLAFRSRIQVLVENKFYLRTFQAMIRFNFFSMKIWSVVLKSILRG